MASSITSLQLVPQPLLPSSRCPLPASGEILDALNAGSLDQAIALPGWVELLVQDGDLLVLALLNMAACVPTHYTTLYLLAVLRHVSTVSTPLASYPSLSVKVLPSWMVRVLVAVIRGGFMPAVVNAAFACLPNDLRSKVWSEALIRPCGRGGSAMIHLQGVAAQALPWLLYMDASCPFVDPWLLARLPFSTTSSLLSVPTVRLDLTDGANEYLFNSSAAHLRLLLPRINQDCLMLSVDNFTYMDWFNMHAASKIPVLLPYLRPAISRRSVIALFGLGAGYSNELFDQQVTCGSWPEYMDFLAARVAAVTRALYLGTCCSSRRAADSCVCVLQQGLP